MLALFWRLWSIIKDPKLSFLQKLSKILQLLFPPRIADDQQPKQKDSQSSPEKDATPAPSSRRQSRRSARKASKLQK